MNFDKYKLYKSLAVIAGICVLVACFTQISKHNSLTLADYEAQHPELAQSQEVQESEDVEKNGSPEEAEEEAFDLSGTENLQETDALLSAAPPIGASLNADSMLENRTTYTDGFYYEPLSDNLRRYITGVSYPGTESDALEISYDDLRYVHVLHYDFEGNLAEGELICNKLITQDIVEIFYELYKNEYFVEKIKLIDEYDGDDDASMADNNTSSFNYRNVAGSTSLSKHSLGLAIDVNPLYNPYITYNGDGTENVSPVSAIAYVDRDNNFPYKIDETDLCYKLFVQHGFIWGGNWNSCKDYQHFQKSEK